jgi:hypothetical protein
MACAANGSAGALAISAATTTTVFSVHGYCIQRTFLFRSSFSFAIIHQGLSKNDQPQRSYGGRIPDQPKPLFKVHNVLSIVIAMLRLKVEFGGHKGVPRQ